MISAKVIADSIAPGCPRLTTLEVEFPKFILAEFNTHRVFCRNFASTRAIPTMKLVQKVRATPFTPVEFSRNRAGMQAGEHLSESEISSASLIWHEAAQAAAHYAHQLSEMGLHKQWAGRVLEPFLAVRGVVTATEWANFFALRRHPDAQPEMRVLADAMAAALEASTPIETQGWHTPYSNGDREISGARCARASYWTHDGVNSTPDADLALCQRLIKSRHMSPFEHVARPMQPGEAQRGPLRGWVQWRHEIEDGMAFEQEPAA